jgi:hypothetical protein
MDGNSSPPYDPILHSRSTRFRAPVAGISLTKGAGPVGQQTGAVVVYFSRLGGLMFAHERTTLFAVAQAIARVKGYQFAGCYDDAGDYPGNVFFVPDDTLMPDEASRLGIRGPNDLFGGVAPHPVAKTKAITHQLIDAGADRPQGWSAVFAERVRGVVLPGYSVFSVHDARIAAERLLRGGPIRLKDPLAAGGRGQTVATTIEEVTAFLKTFQEALLAEYGLVLESNWRDVDTISIGQITLGDTMIAYHGKQRVAINNEGLPVYGGSHLVCVRGGWDALDELPMTDELRLAAAQARLYDEATSEYPGFMASRRNYDIAAGYDGEGRRRSGVLEASWRSGGASTAELAAIQALAQDPALRVVEACAAKQFGTGHEAPRNAIVHYRGIDPEDGPILRYTAITGTSRQNGPEAAPERS